MRMRSLLLCLVLAAGLERLPLRGVEITASGITVPFFDESGKLTHKLLARQGTKSGNIQVLRDVVVNYLSVTDPNLIVQKLETDEATWGDRTQTMTGNGRLVVVTAENRLSGDGFDFAVSNSVWHLHRNFTMSNPEVVLTSDRATVDLVVEKAGDRLKLRDVKRCEALGHLQITVQPTASKKYGFEKLFSEIAIYEGATKMITLPQPSRTLSKGIEVTSQTLTINLKDPAASTTPPAPN